MHFHGESGTLTGSNNEIGFIFNWSYQFQWNN